ncbi:MAG: acyl-CoA thioesterase [Bacillaceae bacterium]|nr:acyl-CoA thioesterase [Bacillaceae bacterium]
MTSVLARCVVKYGTTAGTASEDHDREGFFVKNEFRFYHHLRVRYAEIDGQKIVFNAHYLTYLDIAITEYFRELLGDTWMKEFEDSFDIALVKSTLEFKRPARLDDWLSIGCRIKKLGNSSFTATFQISQKDEAEPNPILLAEQIHVNFDPVTGRSRPIPETVRERILRFEDDPGL